MNRRHEIWRTTFEMGEREPVQIIHDTASPVKLRYFDLRAFPAADRPLESKRLAAADGRTPFHLTQLPLWRAILVRVADEEFHLHMNLHQLVLDGVTVYRILLPELIAIYGAFSQGAVSPLPEPGAQYADFAVWQPRKSQEASIGSASVLVEAAACRRTTHSHVAQPQTPAQSANLFRRCGNALPSSRGLRSFTKLCRT